MNSDGLTDADYDEKLREIGNYLWDLEQGADHASAEGQQPLVEELEARILKQAERAQTFLQVAGSHQILASFVAGLARVSDDPALAASHRSFPSGGTAFSNEWGGLARADLVPGGTWSLGRMRKGSQEIR